MKKTIFLFVIAFAITFDAFSQSVVTTIAGDGRSGLVNGPGNQARFMVLDGIAVDKNGNVYVADYFYHNIRKITPDGIVSTFAGGTTSGFVDGTGTNARFNFPHGLATDTLGNVYVADAHNHRIRKITSEGVVTTFAGSSTPGTGLSGGGSTDGQGSVAQFRLPLGVAVDKDQNIYVSDASNHRIRKITPAGVVSTLAGSTSGYQDGTSSIARFSNPQGIAVDKDGYLYVADGSNHRIRKISPQGTVSTFAGDGSEGYLDGQGTFAKFNRISGLAVDYDGNVFVGDRRNNRIRKISSSGNVTTLAGINYPGFYDGNLNVAMFNDPRFIALDSEGNLIVADNSNYSIRKISEVGAIESPTIRAEKDRALDAIVFPNPANTELHILLPDASPAKIKVMDSSGKIVMIEDAQQSHIMLLQDMAKGLYFVHIEQKNRTTVEKILIE